ncbi:MAG: amidohydrolase family protein [Deltaproteobacteria bacterium]|nr:amidohydrolase family protein [Deltaproteobacteria bacterium]
MSKIIDLRLDFPPTAQKIAETMKFFVLNKNDKGIANYRRIFGPRWAASIGTSFEELEKKNDELSEDQLTTFLQELAQKIIVTPTQFEKQLDEAGIEWGLTDIPEDDETAVYLSQLPERLYGMNVFNPFEVTNAVKNLEHAIREKGFKAVYASPYRWGIKANDPRFYPCYAKAIELDVPVFIYTASHRLSHGCGTALIP